MNEKYFEFCPRLKRILETGETIGAKGQSIPIGALSTRNNLRVLREIIKSFSCQRTMEIGLAFGGSALTILATLKETSKDSFHHTAIDPFQCTLWHSSALTVIEKDGFSAHFSHYNEPSSLALPAMVKEKKQFDLIYIDGSHIFEDVFIDFYYSSILLSQNGIVVFDDCSDKHVKKVIKFILRNYRNILKPLDIGPFEDPEKPLKKRIGNLLGIRQLVGFQKVAPPPRKWNVPFADF